MKRNFLILFISFAFAPALFSQGNVTSFSKSDYFKAISSSSLQLINTELKNISKLNSTEKLAYEGALQMKKAGIMINLAEKLSLFKSGRLKLEEAIKKDMENSEYRFLRLIIQENAPAFLKYNTNISEDNQAITKNLSTLSTEVKQAIRNYSKQSKALKLHD